MKISEMIATLQTILQEHGDVEVCHFPDTDLMVIDHVAYDDGYGYLFPQKQVHEPFILLSGEKAMPFK